MSTSQKGFAGAKDFEGQTVVVEREIVVTETFRGRCVELSDGGALIEYERRGAVIRDFFPWHQVRTMRHREPAQVKRVGDGDAVGEGGEHAAGA